MKLFWTLSVLLIVVPIVANSLPLEDEDTVEDEESDGESSEEQGLELSGSSTTAASTSPSPPPKVPKLLWHRKTEKSYKMLTSGPCSKDLTFLPITGRQDEPIGDCGCHTKVPLGSLDYVPLVYHKGQCHHLYRQGHCPPKKWLVYTSRQQVECMDNPCLKRGFDPDKVLWLENKCVERGHRCFVNNTKIQSDTIFVAFKPMAIYPSCTSFPQESPTKSNTDRDADQDVECAGARRRISADICLSVDVLDLD